MAEILPIRRKTLSNRSTIPIRAMSVADYLKRSPCMQKVECSNLSATDLNRDGPSSLKQIKPSCVSSTVKPLATGEMSKVLGDYQGCPVLQWV